MQLIHRILERLAMATVQQFVLCDASMCGPHRRTAARRPRLKPSACVTRIVWGVWRRRSRHGATRQRGRASPHRRGCLCLPLLLVGAGPRPCQATAGWGHDHPLPRLDEARPCAPGHSWPRSCPHRGENCAAWRGQTLAMPG